MRKSKFHRAADRLHPEAGRRRVVGGGYVPQGWDLDPDVVQLAAEVRWFDAVEDEASAPARRLAALPGSNLKSFLPISSCPAGRAEHPWVLRADVPRGLP